MSSDLLSRVLGRWWTWQPQAVRADTLSAAASCGVFVIGAVALLGWIFDVPVLRSLQSNLISMKVNTAVAFMLTGVALWLLQPVRARGRTSRWTAWACAAVVAALGLLTLAENLLRWDLGIDQILLAEPPGTARTVNPGRVAPNTALNFLLIGLSLLLLDVRTRRGLRPAQHLIALVGVVAGVALLGYGYGVGALVTPSAAVNPMSLPAALCGLLAFAGLLLARPGPWLVAILTGEQPGSVVARRFLLPIMLLPTLADVVFLAGQRAGLYDAHVAAAAHAVLMTALLLALALALAASLNRAADQLESDSREEAGDLPWPASALESPSRPGMWLVWTIAMVAAATLLRLGLLQALGTRATYITFYPAVILAALYGGLPAGLVATVLSGLAADYFWLEPVSSFGIAHPADWLSIALFLASGTMISGVAEALHRARARARRAEIAAQVAVERQRAAQALEMAYGELEERVQERTAELKQANTYNRSLLEVSLDPLVTIGRDGRLTDVNAAAETATGLGRDALIGTDFSDYFTAPAKARAGYQLVFREGYVRDYPLELRHCGGRVTPVLYNAAVYRDESGQAIGVFAAARDITEQKRAQDEVRRYTEDLRRSNQELEHFAYVASHDLQEPLRVVSSFSQLLARRYEGKLGGDADEFIAFVVDGAKRMQILINDLLAYSRVGTRGRELAPVACQAALDAARENLELAVAESGAVITHDPLPTVKADPMQLTQVFQNLISNAIRFRRPQTPPRIHVSAERQDSLWRLSVRDNGIGIEPQYFDRIFIIFQRLHDREQYPGTGIGLAICKKIVERHGGSMWVESEPGAGSTFHFTLPEAREDHEQPRPAGPTH